MVNTPVLYITFVRPEYASQSFSAIKKAQPRKLYFYSNKAREDRPDEVRRNEEVRSYIKQIDWDCDVKTWFRDEYVDVFTSLWGAIDWIFNNEEEAIIVEEDCVASVAFFDLCDKLLPRYRKEKKIQLISGDNFTPQYNPKGLDYFFSRYMHIYGWASWKDRWSTMDRMMTDWPEIKKKSLKKHFDNWLACVYYRIFLDKVYNEISVFNPWDFITLYNMIRNDSYCVFPAHNLVDDIGDIGANTVISAKEVRLEPYEETTYPTDRYPRELNPCNSYDCRHFIKHIFWRLLKFEVRKLLVQAFSSNKIDRKRF